MPRNNLNYHWVEPLDLKGWCITNVPSNRNQMVENFARRLALRLHIRYVSLLAKKPGFVQPQKEMQNSRYQYLNVRQSVERTAEKVPAQVILVDDLVDSRWTLTVCGSLLTEDGALMVFPFCLADSSREDVMV